MEKIAINIILLPSEKIIDDIINLNKKITKNNQTSLKLGKKTNVPHITLAMGCIDKSDIKKISQILEETSQKFKKLSLTFEELRTEKLPNNDIFIGLKVRIDDKIKILHKEILSSLSSYLEFNPTKNMFIKPEEIEDITLSRVKSWKNKIDNVDSYAPHTSVGIGKLIDYELPINFIADKIAISQLGNYCSSRNILFSTNLI